MTPPGCAPRSTARIGAMRPVAPLPRVSPTSLVPRSISTTLPSTPKVSVAVMQVVIPGRDESMAVSSVQSMKAPLGTAASARAGIRRAHGCRSARDEGGSEIAGRREPDAARPGATAPDAPARGRRTGERQRYMSRWITRTKTRCRTIPAPAPIAAVSWAAERPPFQRRPASAESPAGSEPPALGRRPRRRRTGSKIRRDGGAPMRPKLGSGKSLWARWAAADCACSLARPVANHGAGVIPDERPQSQGAHESDGQHVADPGLGRGSQAENLVALALHIRRSPPIRCSLMAHFPAIGARRPESRFRNRAAIRRRRSPCWRRNPPDSRAGR